MGADILTADLYPSVRAALDVSLDAATLPDGVIGLDIYAGAAERWVKANDPQWSAHLAVPDDAMRLRNAAVYSCAALLAYAVPVLTREDIGQSDYSYSRDAIAPADLAAQLRTRAAAELAGLLPVGTAGALPFFFGVAPGARRWPFPDRQALPPGTIVAGV